MGTMLLGPRLGRFSKEGYVVHFANASPASMTLGTFILWLGW
jgi:Amt family ammonium transporter